VPHFKSSTLITFQDQRLKENDSNKSCREQRGLSNSDLGFDIEGHFQGHLKVNFRFLNGNPYFFITYSCSLSRELSKTL